MILNEKVFAKHDSEINLFRRVKFWIKTSSSGQILNEIIDNLSDFKITFSQRVSFDIKNFITRQIWKRNNPHKSTTYTFHIVFFHLVIYSYRLRYLRQLDISIRHRSNNTSCTLFRKDFHSCFRCGNPLSSLNLLDICKDQLLLIVNLQHLIQFYAHRCLASFWKMLW